MRKIVGDKKDWETFTRMRRSHSQSNSQKYSQYETYFAWFPGFFKKIPSY